MGTLDARIAPGVFFPVLWRRRRRAQMWGVDRVGRYDRCDVKKIPVCLVDEMAKSGKTVAYYM
jgi:hypothetical protein